MKKIKAVEFTLKALLERAEDTTVRIYSKEDTQGLMAYRIKEAECNAYKRVLELIKELDNKQEQPIDEIEQYARN